MHPLCSIYLMEFLQPFTEHCKGIGVTGEIQTLSRGVCRLVEYTKETAEMYMTL